MLCINQNVISIISYRKNFDFNLFIPVFFRTLSVCAISRKSLPSIRPELSSCRAQRARESYFSRFREQQREE